MLTEQKSCNVRNKSTMCCSYPIHPSLSVNRLCPQTGPAAAQQVDQWSLQLSCCTVQNRDSEGLRRAVFDKKVRIHTTSWYSLQWQSLVPLLFIPSICNPRIIPTNSQVAGCVRRVVISAQEKAVAVCEFCRCSIMLIGTVSYQWTCVLWKK